MIDQEVKVEHYIRKIYINIMCKKSCKECPWVVRNKFNDMIIGHSMKHDKPHNCHMIPPEKRGGLWETKEETKCIGRKQFEKQQEYESNIIV
jgi:hypothetical protein